MTFSVEDSWVSGRTAKSPWRSFTFADGLSWRDDVGPVLCSRRRGTEFPAELLVVELADADNAPGVLWGKLLAEAV